MGCKIGNLSVVVIMPKKPQCVDTRDANINPWHSLMRFVINPQIAAYTTNKTASYIPHILTAEFIESRIHTLLPQN